ncbi:MAG: hypothetical protein CMH53_09520 [Myxococcales bacterium]|nr:hypothetical protein [Myxococcales bacterium]
MKVGIQRLAICLALGSLCGCSGGQVAVKGEQDIGPIRALVRRGAWIHQAPTSQSPRARDALLSDRAYRVGRAFAVEVIGQKGPWVQARIQLRDAANHPSCVRSLWAFRGLGVQVYIHAKDLVPALTRTLRIEHPDGTEATLVAGTPVWPIAGTERYRIRTRRFRFHARVPEDALGLTWRYSGHFEPDESSQTLRPDHRAALLGTRDLVNTLRWTPTYVLDQRSVKAGQLLMVGDRCSRLALVGSSSDLASRRVSPGAGGQAVSMALMRRAKGPAM